jgi:hypothetical protein
VTVEELIAKLEAIRDDAAAAMPACAEAMAGTYKDHLVRVTLRRTYASPFPGPPGKGQYGTPAPEGGPPAYRFGNLSRSVIAWPGAFTGVSATAHVAPTVIYAGVQEFGAEIGAHRMYMRWFNSRGWWYKKHVSIPKRPYLEPALNETVADGSLVRAAAERFAALMGL